MLAVLNITFPIFAIIALGFALTRRGLFAAQDLAALGRFVLNVALPALIFSAMTSRPIAEAADAGYLLAYGAATVLTMAICWGLLTLSGNRGARRGVGVLGVACSNSGYVGYPVILLAWPDQAATVLTLQVIVENFLAIPLAILVAESASPRLRSQPLQVARAIALGILRRPMIQAVLLGLAVNLSGLALPGALNHMLSLLASATSAVALFCIGGTLADLRARPGNAQLAGIVVATKLFLMPALAAAMIWLLPQLGLPPVADWLVAPLLLSASLPMMGIYPILARDYGEEGVAAVALLAATILSFFTLTAALTMLHPAPL